MRQDRSLAGRVILITGSSRGIGRETARAFCREGAHVVLHGRDETVLNATREDLEQEGCAVTAVAADITSAQECERMVHTIVDEHGQLDCVINNAGVSMRGAFDTLHPEVIETLFRTNSMGSALVTRAALLHVRESRGSIVFISSLAGVRGFPGVSVYSASKMALTALAEALDAELSADGVHTGILYVGFTENDPDKWVLDAEGGKVTISRSASLTQQAVAQRVLTLVKKRKRKTVMTGTGHILSIAQRFLPRLVDALIRRSRGKIHAPRR